MFGVQSDLSDSDVAIYSGDHHVYAGVTASFSSF